MGSLRMRLCLSVVMRVAIHEPGEGGAAVDLVAVGFWRNAGDFQVVVHDQDGIVVSGEAHGAGGEQGAGAGDFRGEGILGAGFVVEVEGGQGLPGLGEGLEIRRQRNAGEGLGQIVGEAGAKIRGVQHAVDVIKDGVLGDGGILIVGAESGQGGVGDVVDALQGGLIHERK